MPEEMHAEPLHKPERPNFWERLASSLRGGWKRMLLKAVLSVCFIIFLGGKMLQHQFNLLGNGQATWLDVFLKPLSYGIKRAFIIVYPYLASFGENWQNHMYGNLFVTGILSIMAFFMVFLWVSVIIDVIDLSESDSVNWLIKGIITCALVFVISMAFYYLTGQTDLVIAGAINTTIPPVAETTAINTSIAII